MGQKKGIPLYVEKILKEQTDKNHVLNATQIANKIYDSFGIKPDRRTIYDSIELLNSLQEDQGISAVEQTKDGYYWYDRMFDFQESTLLINAVSGFPFLREREVKDIIDKIKHTRSVYDRPLLANLNYIKTQNQTENKYISTILNTLDEAIRNNQKVQFTYLKYNKEKNLVAKRDRVYTVSPYGMVFTNEHYYLACSYEGYETLSLYRIDRIKDIKPIDEQITIHLDKKKIRSATEYSPFAMVGEPVRFSMIIKDFALDATIDRFGRDVFVSQEDETHYLVSGYSSARGLLIWGQAFLDSAEILEPKDVRDELIKIVSECAYMKEAEKLNEGDSQK